MKVKNNLLISCALFILLIVLSFSWVSGELFTNLESNEYVENHSVSAVHSHTNGRNDPSGYDGLVYQQSYNPQQVVNGPPQ